MTGPLPYRLGPKGLSLFVRVTPNGGRDAVEGVELRGDGAAMVRLRVRAVPDAGKANTAVIALLAKALDLPKSTMRVTAGATARFKTLSITGDVADLVNRLELCWAPRAGDDRDKSSQFPLLKPKQSD